MAVKIKRKRIGKIHAPQYRIVIADSRTARNGRAIEEIGIYQPMNDPSIIKVNSERALYWLGVGAQPTEAVTALLKITGDWQKFKGLPGTEGTLRVAEPKIAKILVFEAAVQDAAKEPKSPAKKPKLDTAADAAPEAAKTVVDEVVEAVEAAVEAVVEGVEKAVEAAVEAVEGVVGGESKADESKADEANSDEAAAASTDAGAKGSA